MGSTLVLSNNPVLADQWKAILSKEGNVWSVNNIAGVNDFISSNPTDILIIDADLLDSNDVVFNQIKKLGLKTLIIGRNWSEDKQIHALVSGMSGYCEHEDAPIVLLKAIASISKGDIWLQRHLIPKVIGQLVSLTNAQINQPKKTHLNNNLQLLTQRERDVTKIICTGGSNKVIASLLNISERTVKAHLTSIFQKLDIQDRLQLAILFKEII